MAELKETKFRITLNKDDWDNRLKGWRCSVLIIPGVKILDLFEGSDPVSEKLYYSDIERKMIIWKAGREHPKEISIYFNLTQRLSTQAQTNRWKNGAFFGGFMAILTPIIVNFSSEVLKGWLGHKDYSQDPLKELKQNSVPVSSSRSESESESESETISPPISITRSVPTMNSDEMLDILNRFLDEKKEIFAPPFDKAVLKELVHQDSKLYRHFSKDMDELKSKGNSFEYLFHEVEYEAHASQSELPELVVFISDYSILHTPDGVDESYSNPQQKYLKFFFKQEDDIWKIFDMAESW